MEHLNAPSVVSSVKTADFGPFLDGSDKKGAANAILDSFKSIGFVYLVNHGLDDVKIIELIYKIYLISCYQNSLNLLTYLCIPSIG